MQAIPHLSAGHEFALLASEGGVIDDESHLQSGFINPNQRQGLGVIGAGDCFANIYLVKAGYSHEIASAGLLNLNALQTLEAKQLADAAALDAAVVTDKGSSLASPDCAVVDASDHDPT